MAKGSGGHWYNQQGEADYGGDIRRAKKLNLLPSPSGILGILDKYNLNKWKVEMAILAAFTLPRKDGEQDDAFIARVQEDMYKPSETAMDLGTELHEMAEWYLTGRAKQVQAKVVANEALGDLWVFVEEWIRDQSGYRQCKDPADGYEGLSERVVVNLREGYGGRADRIATLMDGRTVVVDDFKTTFIKAKYAYNARGELKDPPFKAWDDWPRQLAAYLEAWKLMLEEGPGIKQDLRFRIRSVVISTNPEIPGCWTKDWTEEETAQALDVFRSVHAAYRVIKKWPYVREVMVSPLSPKPEPETPVEEGVVVGTEIPGLFD
jgi:hypothetical protein